ncbi:MAG: hypothetical protein ACPGQD_03410 [Planctomycetota bacterium]
MILAIRVLFWTAVILAILLALLGFAVIAVSVCLVVGGVIWVLDRLKQTAA